MTKIFDTLEKDEDGLGFFRRSNLNQMSGLSKHLTLAEFNTAVAIERSRIDSNGVGVFHADEPCSIIGQAGVRRWVVGSDSATSHWRTVEIGPLRFVLDTDDEVVHPLMAPPAAGLGLNGHRAYDYSAMTLYAKAGGNWTVQKALGGGSVGPTAPGAPMIVAATPGDGVVNLTYVAPASDGGSPIIEYQAETRDGAAVQTGTQTGTGLSRAIPSPNGTPVNARVRARNAVDYGPWSAMSASVTPSAPAPLNWITIAPGARGQWVSPNIITCTVDRDLVGNYYIAGTAGNSGGYLSTKLGNDGVAIETVTTPSTDEDDHNVKSYCHLPDGRVFAMRNRHSIAGSTGFRYQVSATPHQLDFGPTVEVPGSLLQSTYNQCWMVGNRLFVMWRSGSSSGGQWILRYTDDLLTWSPERVLHSVTYMNTAVVGTVLRCLCYLHPVSGSNHHVSYFEIDLITGEMSAGAGSLGNAFSAGAGIPVANMRRAITAPANTSLRMFEWDGETVGYMLMPDVATSPGSSPGEYFLGYRNGTSGLFAAASLGGTGPAFIANVYWYYGSCARLSANYAVRSVNKGSTIGLGSWALELLQTTDGGTTWAYVETLLTSTSIIARLSGFEDWIVCTLFSKYDDYTDITAETRWLKDARIAYTKAPSVPSRQWPAVTATEPDAPTDVVATAGNGVVNLTWTPPANNGGAPITGNRLVWSGGQSLTIGAGASGQIPGVTNDVAGTAVVYAINAIGEGPASDPSNSVTPTASAGPTYTPAVAEVMSLSADDGNGTFHGLAGSELKNGKVLLTHSLTLDGDGDLVTQFLNDGLTAGGIAFHTSSSPTIAYNTCPYGVNWSSASGALAYASGTGVETAISGPMTAPTWIHLRRQGDTVTIETSPDQVNRTVRHTFAATTTARLTARVFTTIATSGATLTRYVRSVGWSGDWVDDVVVP